MIDAIRNLKSRVNNVAGRALLTLINITSGKALVQVTGRVGEIKTDVEFLQPYGLRAKPLAGASGILVSYGGNRENGSVHTIDDQRYGQDALGDGDVMLYNEASARVKLVDDTILASADTQIKATVGTTSVDIVPTKILGTVGTTTVEATGSKVLTTVGTTTTEVTASEVKLTVASTFISVVDGSVTFSIDGVTWVFDATTMTGTADIVTTGVIDSDGVELKLHTHSGVTTGGGNTGNPN